MSTTRTQCEEKRRRLAGDSDPHSSDAGNGTGGTQAGPGQANPILARPGSGPGPAPSHDCVSDKLKEQHIRRLQAGTSMTVAIALGAPEAASRTAVGESTEDDPTWMDGGSTSRAAASASWGGSVARAGGMPRTNGGSALKVEDKLNESALTGSKALSGRKNEAALCGSNLKASDESALRGGKAGFKEASMTAPKPRAELELPGWPGPEAGPALARPGLVRLPGPART